MMLMLGLAGLPTASLAEAGGEADGEAATGGGDGDGDGDGIILMMVLGVVVSRETGDTAPERGEEAGSACEGEGSILELFRRLKVKRSLLVDLALDRDGGGEEETTVVSDAATAGEGV